MCKPSPRWLTAVWGPCCNVVLPVFVQTSDTDVLVLLLQTRCRERQPLTCASFFSLFRPVMWDDQNNCHFNSVWLNGELCVFWQAAIFRWGKVLVLPWQLTSGNVIFVPNHCGWFTYFSVLAISTAHVWDKRVKTLWLSHHKLKISKGS